MNAIAPVGLNIQNFEVPGVIVVISPTPNFQVPGVIKPQMSVVIKPQKSGVIATPPVEKIGRKFKLSYWTDFDRK